MSGLGERASSPMVELVVSIPGEELEEGLEEIIATHSRYAFRRWAAQVLQVCREVRIAMEVQNRGN